MMIDAPTPGAVRYVASGMRRSDIDEFMALSPVNTEQELKASLIENYGEHPDGFAFFADDNEPIGVGAMVQARPNVVTLLFFATEKFTEIAGPLARFTKQRLFPRYRDAGVHRIECVSIAGYAPMHRWIQMVGLQEEAVMKGYGKGGETFHQFAWVRDDVRQTGA
jgi:hypothetical protein